MTGEFKIEGKNQPALKMATLKERMARLLLENRNQDFQLRLNDYLYFFMHQVLTDNQMQPRRALELVEAIYYKDSTKFRKEQAKIIEERLVKLLEKTAKEQTASQMADIQRRLCDLTGCTLEDVTLPEFANPFSINLISCILKTWEELLNKLEDVLNKNKN